MYIAAQHHNIVKLEDYFENQDYIYFCLELHSNLTLYDFVTTYSAKITEEKARSLFRGIASAVAYLHEQGIVLKNLSAFGILMTSVQKESDQMMANPRIN